MEKIIFQPDGEEAVEFYVLDQTTLGGINYLLVTDVEEGDGDAYIMKDVSEADDTEGVYQMVEDDEEMDAVAAVFENLLEDVDFVKEEE